MNDRKTWLALVVAVAMAAGVIVFWMFRVKEVERSLRIQKEQALSSKALELAQLQAELAKVNEAKKELEERLEETLALQEIALEDQQRAVDSLNVRVADLMKEKEGLSKAVLDHSAQMKKYTQRIRQLEREKKELQESLQKFKDEKEASEAARRSDEEPEIVDLDIQEKTPAPDVVDLGKLVIRRDTQEAASIEHVNTLWGFVVINAGSDDGLKPDAVLNVSRNNRFVARVVVKKVRPNVSTAVTLPEWTHEPVKPGDRVSVSFGDR